MSTESLRVLVYHRIVERPDPRLDYRGVISATPAGFQRHMRLLARRYRVVAVEEVLAAQAGCGALPARAVLVTFDDGYRDFGEVAWPIMRRYGLPATVFVPTSTPDHPLRRLWWDRLAAACALAQGAAPLQTPLGGLPLQPAETRERSLRLVRDYLKSIPHAEAMALVERFCAELGEPAVDGRCFHSWDELRALAADGVTVAAHTRTHPALTRLSAEAARAEIRGAREDLLREIGSCLPVFCYPFGDHDDQVASLVGAEGFRLALTCLEGQNRLPLAEPLRLRRTSISARTTPIVFHARLTAAGAYLDVSRSQGKLRRRSGRLALLRQAEQRRVLERAPQDRPELEARPVPSPAAPSPQRLVAEPRTAPSPLRDSARHERRFLRGSSLLLAGRMLSVLLNFLVQVITVRYLAKADYGAFAYVLALVAIGTDTIHLGMDKSLPRLVPIYNESRDYPRTFGTIGLATASIWGLGICLMALLLGFRGLLARTLVTDPKTLALLLILMALAPIQAYTAVLEKLVAVFANARDIFVRRHILGPGTKLAAVLLVVLTAGDVRLLAWGYVVGGVIGAALYIGILLRQWRKNHLLRYLRPRRMTWPVRELFRFSLPLLSGQGLLIMRTSLVVIVLEYFASTTAVAAYRAAFSVAGLNLLVFESFSLLFVPVAARMFAQGDREGIVRLFWKTSNWMTVLTFPIFIITCGLAQPVTLLLFGSAYADAAAVLAVLALGNYFVAVMGFNLAALNVFGKLRLIVAAEVATAAGAVVLAFLLIPRYGALGAAFTTTGFLALHNLFCQLGLWFGGTGIRLIDPRFLRGFALAVSMTLIMLAIEKAGALSFQASLALAALVTWAMFRLARRDLQLDETFPELLRIPLLRRLVG